MVEAELSPILSPILCTSPVTECKRLRVGVGQRPRPAKIPLWMGSRVCPLPPFRVTDPSPNISSSHSVNVSL
jgi:hypothetical protein